jgi:hypothetical protein
MSENMVQILVPEKHVVAIYGYIASLERKEAGDEALVDATPSELRHNGPSEDEEWSPKKLRLLYEQSPPATSSELVEVLKDRKPDANSNTLAGTLGAFGRRVANRYGMESWPFEAYYSHEHYSLVYWMDGWVAEKLRGFKNG